MNIGVPRWLIVSIAATFSAYHLVLATDSIDQTRNHVPVIVGGIISAEDENVLRNMGAAAIYTPKDYALDAIMADMVLVIDRARGRAAEAELEMRAAG